jgi:hypothetical protein
MLLQPLSRIKKKSKRSKRGALTFEYTERQKGGIAQLWSDRIPRFKKLKRRTIMKRKIARTSLAVHSFAVLLTLMPAAHASTCTMASVAGNWGYTYTGVLILPSGPVPVAAVGRFTADVSGNISGTQTRTLAGATAHEVIKGSNTVNSDCTATATIGVYDQSGNLLRTGVIAAVYVNNGREVREIFESLTLTDGTSLPVVITAEANKITDGE